jgi:hypothetical protein
LFEVLIIIAADGWDVFLEVAGFRATLWQLEERFQN